MVRALGHRPGGITSLLNILDSPEYGEAAEYELLRFDRRPEQLGTDDLTWRDLQLIVKFAPQDSPLVRTMNPDSIWGLQEQLMAEAVDTLHWLRWAKTKAAEQKRDHPEPIPRPGIEVKEVIGSDPVDVDEMDRLLGWD
ncbi:hypothetical protein RhoFasGS6_03916 [Rhodococcus fascians]|nr:hypothetical protein [Rhodococcus fascians]